MAPSAVFVDSSGRRARWFARAVWTAGALLTGYVVLVVLSLVAPPGVSRLGLGPLLPRPAAPPLIDSTGAHVTPRQVLASPTPSPSSRPTRAPTPTGAPVSPTAGTATPVPTRRPTAAPSPSPSASSRPSPSGRSTTRATPRPSHTPPPHP